MTDQITAEGPIADAVAAVGAADAVQGLAPGTDQWQQCITASKVAAILGVDGFGGSRYQMWQQIAGRWHPTFNGNSATDRGTCLEAGVAEWWLLDHPGYEIAWAGTWRSRRAEWAYATPDYLVQEPDGTLALLEVKTSARMDGWGDPARGEIPMHYWTQIAWQAIVTGVKRVHVTVLGTFLERTDYLIEFDDFILDNVFEEVQGFYDTLPGQPHEEEPESTSPLLDWEAILAVTAVSVEQVDVSEEYGAYRDAKLQEREAKAAVDDAKKKIVVLAAAGQEATVDGKVVAVRNKKGDNFTFRPVKKPS